MTTTLKLGPLPNSVAEWPHRDVKALGRAICKNSKEECTCVYSVPVVCTYTVSCITIIYTTNSVDLEHLPHHNYLLTMQFSLSTQVSVCSLAMYNVLYMTQYTASMLVTSKLECVIFHSKTARSTGIHSPIIC